MEYLFWIQDLILILHKFSHSRENIIAMGRFLSVIIVVTICCGFLVNLTSIKTMHSMRFDYWINLQLSLTDLTSCNLVILPSWTSEANFILFKDFCELIHMSYCTTEAYVLLLGGYTAVTLRRRWRWSAVSSLIKGIFTSVLFIICLFSAHEGFNW